MQRSLIMEERPAVIDCPDEVADVVLTILKDAILSMRIAGYAGNAEYCAIQANHIHNLPVLLRHYRRERLESYLKYGRGHYIRDMREIPGANPEAFDPLWQRLEEFLAIDAT